MLGSMWKREKRYHHPKIKTKIIFIYPSPICNENYEGMKKRGTYNQSYNIRVERLPRSLKIGTNKWRQRKSPWPRESKRKLRGKHSLAGGPNQLVVQPSWWPNPKDGSNDLLFGTRCGYRECCGCYPDE